MAKTSELQAQADKLNELYVEGRVPRAAYIVSIEKLHRQMSQAAGVGRCGCPACREARGDV